jgi:major membrane immunogen (membrane-anchored lipoprotein)
MGIRHVLAGAVVVSSGLLLTACDWGDFDNNEFSDQESLTQSVSEVRFVNGSGDVKITVGDKLEVHRRVGYRDSKPGKTYRVDGAALVLEECKERHCWVSYDVTVPEGTKVSGHLDSGNVELTGVASANVEADSGDVTVRNVAGEVNAKASSGNITLSEIGGAVVAEADSGDINVGLTEADDVTANASSGNVEVTVPAGDYQVNTNTSDSGHVTNDLGDSDRGPKITIKTDSGNVTLRAA